MKFRNAFRLMTDNFGNVYKLLLFRAVTGILFMSLVLVILERGLDIIVYSPEAVKITELFKEFFKELSTGSPNFEVLYGYRDNITAAVKDFFQMVGTKIGSIIASVVGIVVIYLFTRFLNGTANFAAGSILNDKMQAYSKTRFSSAYFQHLRKSVIYQIIYVPCSFLYDVLALAGCWFFFFYTPSLLPTSGILTVFLGLSLSVTAFIVLLAVKLTLISAWIPSIITDEMTVKAGMSKSFRAKKGFAGRLSSFLVAIYLIFGINVLFGLFTFGSMLLITIPASYFFILCLQFVYYYEENNKKYFVSFRKISGADGMPDGMGE